VRELDCAYLYEDGHLVQVWKDKVKGIEIKYVTIVEKYAERGPKGRLVLHFGGKPFLDSMKGGRVEAALPALQHGSDRSKELGIPIGYVSWHDKKGQYANIILLDCLSGSFTYQPDVCETYEETKGMYRWSSHQIRRD